MPVILDEGFVAEVRRSATSRTHRGTRVIIRESTAVRNGHGAVLEVLRADKIVGYLSPYSDKELGACSAAAFGDGLPRVFTLLSPALDEILRLSKKPVPVRPV